ncbi:unnamed protein product, partial [Iphiclides podalirius]
MACRTLDTSAWIFPDLCSVHPSAAPRDVAAAVAAGSSGRAGSIRPSRAPPAIPLVRPPAAKPPRLGGNSRRPRSTGKPRSVSA